MNFYNGKVIYYNETEGKTTEEPFLTCGENFSDALNRVIKFYGEEWIEGIDISYYTDNELLPIPKEVLDSYDY